MGITATVPPDATSIRTRPRRVCQSDAGAGCVPLAGVRPRPVPAPSRGRRGAPPNQATCTGHVSCTLEHGMTTASPDIDLAALIADTEGEIVRLVRDRDPSTHGLYEMVRYHLALDGSGASGGKRMRPLLGLLAYASITGEHQRALPGAAAVELGHNFSLVHDDIEDGDVERRHRATLWTVHGVPQAINTGDTLFSLSRIALHRLTDLGFPDRTVLRLMRLFDETCLALCEGQYIDIAMGASDELVSVELYFDMIGRKTAALIAASIEAGAVLATEDEEVIARYRGFGWALGLAFQLNDDLLGIWGRRGRRARSRRTSSTARSPSPSSTHTSMPVPRIVSASERSMRTTT